MWERILFENKPYNKWITVSAVKYCKQSLGPGKHKNSMKKKHALMSLCRFVEVLVVGPPMKLCMEIFVKEGVRVGKFENLKIFLQKIYLKFFIKYSVHKWVTESTCKCELASRMLIKFSEDFH